MPKIAIIVPGNLVDTARMAADEIKEDITILEGSMSKGVEMAAELEREGYEVFITRGGTELLIEKSDIKVPIVSLSFTPMDILKAVKEAEKISNRIAIIAFENILPAIESYEEIAEIKLEKYLVSDEEEVAEKMADIVRKDIKVVIGGGIISQFAERYGVVPVVISTGREVFINAIIEAKRMALATRREKEQGEKFKAIIEHTYNGIISVDSKGNIKTFNPAAERLLNFKSIDVADKNINEVLPEIEINDTLNQGIEEMDVIRNINGNKFMFSNIPIKVENQVVGAISFFHDIKKIQQMEEKIRREVVEAGHYAKYTFDDVIGKSEEIKELIRISKEYARVDSTILIQGETGTGKEVIAQSIHNYSLRAMGPFVAVNCAALPESLLESELFGYVAGSFTGADKRGKKGFFELAHGGTIFLDEISEMNPLLQGRLLRVLQEKQIMRIGDNKLMPVDVRIIAATNRKLEQHVKEGKFREDLYYRLNILKLNLIPLRERKEDISYLINEFIKVFSRKLGKERVVLSSRALEYLCCYEWPGNVREIKNFAERIVVISKKICVELEDIRTMFPDVEAHSDKLYGDFLSIDNSMRMDIYNELKKNSGNISETAKMLGISRTTLWRRMKKYNIKVDK